MSTTDDTTLTAAWREVLERHARVSGALDRELEALHGIGSSEFDVLEFLATAPTERCQMKELSAAVHLSQSALSRLVGRLEDDGLVARAMCSHDRRGIYAAITDAGRARYEEARPTHRDVLARTWPAPTPAS